MSVVWKFRSLLYKSLEQRTQQFGIIGISDMVVTIYRLVHQEILRVGEGEGTQEFVL